MGKDGKARPQDDEEGAGVSDGAINEALDETDEDEEDETDDFNVEEWE